MATDSIAREGNELESAGPAVLNGYSAAQLEDLLGCISASADTLENLAAYAAQGGDAETQYQILAIQAIAQKIGALADAPLNPGDRAQSGGALAWFGFKGVAHGC